MYLVMTTSYNAALLKIMTKIIKQIKLFLIQPDRNIMAFYNLYISFMKAFFIKELKQNKELFSIRESARGET